MCRGKTWQLDTLTVMFDNSAVTFAVVAYRLCLKMQLWQCDNASKGRWHQGLTSVLSVQPTHSPSTLRTRPVIPLALQTRCDGRANLVPSSGFWQSAADSVNVVACPNAAACQGNRTVMSQCQAEAYDAAANASQVQLQALLSRSLGQWKLSISDTFMPYALMTVLDSWVLHRQLQAAL